MKKKYRKLIYSFFAYSCGTFSAKGFLFFEVEEYLLLQRKYNKSLNFSDEIMQICNSICPSRTIDYLMKFQALKYVQNESNVKNNKILFSLGPKGVVVLTITVNQTESVTSLKFKARWISNS